jgi:hypothetical protein
MQLSYLHPDQATGPARDRAARASGGVSGARLGARRRGLTAGERAIASFLFGLVGIRFGGWFGYLIAGFIGACILIFIVRSVRGSPATR